MSNEELKQHVMDAVQNTNTLIVMVADELREFRKHWAIMDDLTTKLRMAAEKVNISWHELEKHGGADAADWWKDES